MTVPTQTNKAIFTANGVTTGFPFTFGTLPTADIVVTLIDGDTETVVNPSDYTVRGAGRDDGGSVVFNDPPASGLTVLIQRLVPYTQPTDYKNQGSFYPRTHERSFDRVTMQVQQLAEEVSRSLRIRPDYTLPVSLDFPTPEASRLIGWNADGSALRNTDPSGPGDLLLRSDLADPTGGAAMVAFTRAIPGALPSNIAKEIARLPVTPQTFGARGDGVSDDSSAMAAFFAQAEHGYIPPGTYMVRWNSIIRTAGNQTITGAGERSVIKLIGGEVISQSGGVVRAVGAPGNLLKGIDWSGFSIDGNKDNITATIALNDCECLNAKYVEDSSFTRIKAFNGIHEGIDLDHSTRCWVAFNHCHDNRGYGIHISEGSVGNTIIGNIVERNGHETFRGGMDAYEAAGFDPATNNIYVSNIARDNYINYRIKGSGNVAFGNQSGVATNPDDCSGVGGGFTALGGDASDAPLKYRANEASALSRILEISNSAGNIRARLQFEGGTESLVVTDRFDNVLHRFSATGTVSPQFSFESESGQFGAISYDTRTGLAREASGVVTLNLRIAVSSVDIGTASGRLLISGLPAGMWPAGETALSVSAVSRWGFPVESEPASILAVVRADGLIELRKNSPNGNTERVSVSDLRLSGLTFMNQIYLAGSFIKAS